MTTDVAQFTDGPAV